MSKHLNFPLKHRKTPLSQVIVKLTGMRVLSLEQDDPLLPFLAINSRMLQNLEALFIAICPRGERGMAASPTVGVRHAQSAVSGQAMHAQVLKRFG